MSSNNILLSNELIHMILLHCQTAKDYLSQSLVNHQWSYEARRLKSLMKVRFSRTITFLNWRFLFSDFDIRVNVVGYDEYLQRHGLEECVQNYHRVGGPGSNVYYLERYWQDGRLHGLEIIREINAIWYTKYYANHIDTSDETIDHPYDGLQAVDSMRKYRRHRLVSKNEVLPEECDSLGKIIFKYEWKSVTLEESKEIRRNSIHDDDLSDVHSLYDFIDGIDLYKMSVERLSI
ncbi:unnamed protein product [Rotaria socialis]|uniref:F-box domain-containing protein n=1 Tax=Rotaria socialis TaxID=392032 RepID=A0A820TQ83_9BILA|nr:unnamed protein product [Rotaria socialis]CAF4474740.1 unnamed protein product [Rotaria socialis]